MLALDAACEQIIQGVNKIGYLDLFQKISKVKTKVKNISALSYSDGYPKEGKKSISWQKGQRSRCYQAPRFWAKGSFEFFLTGIVRKDFSHLLIDNSKVILIL